MRILLAIDGSRSSIQARDLVASLSIPGGSSVTMLTAYEIPAAWFGDPLAAGGAGLAEAEEAVRRDAEQHSPSWPRPSSAATGRSTDASSAAARRA